MSDYRCYICGAERQRVDVTQFDNPESQYMPGLWPPGDHTHAVAPPTPSELLAGADEALAAIIESWK
jgi:hypothetical protein